MSNIFNYNKIYKAYLDCRKNKRSTVNALKFEWDLERNLFELQEELETKNYKPGCSVCFIVTDPSPREIFAASFKDRVVHHLLVNELEEIGERAFIYDSYACRKEKGTHKAVNRLRSFTRKITNNYNQRAFYLQLDVSGFFVNINRNILFSILKQLVLKQERSCQWKKDVLWLARIIVFYEPTKNYIIKGDPCLFNLIHPRKSLFKAKAGKGLPIGNYSSQFFANLYLNELDQFIKRHLKQKYYLRYADDFIILGKNKKDLQSLIGKTEDFLKQKLGLKLNTKKTKLKKVSQGIDFLGYFIKPSYVLVRKSALKRIKNKLYGFEHKGKEIESKQFLAILNSYFGHFRQADTFGLRKNIYENHLRGLKNCLGVNNNYSIFYLK